MYILAIETTGPLCSVALLEKNKILDIMNTSEQKNHLRDLIPLIKELLISNNIEKSQIDYMAASVGPGSFTGIRIGVSTARALAQVLEIPAVSVPTLDAFRKKPLSSGEKNCVICGIINARRGQVYGMIDGFMNGCACMMTDVLDVIERDVVSNGLHVKFSETELMRTVK